DRRGQVVAKAQDQLGVLTKALGDLRQRMTCIDMNQDGPFAEQLLDETALVGKAHGPSRFRQWWRGRHRLWFFANEVQELFARNQADIVGIAQQRTSVVEPDTGHALGQAFSFGRMLQKFRVSLE